jgi:glycosyltransferase involved in cell wall biosynthesis
VARILWFHPRQLLPPRGGGDHRTLGLVRGALAAGHEVLLVDMDEGLAGAEPPDGLRIAGLTSHAGLTLVAAKLVSTDPLRSPRPTRAALATARRTIEAFAPEVAVVSEVMTWGLARRLMPDVSWIYDSQNVEHALFAGHLASATGPVEKLTFRLDQHRVASAERALLGRSAATLVVSEDDAAGLRLVDPGAELVLAPSSMSAPAAACDPGAAGPVALFVGTLDFPPNIEAIELLVTQVMPRLRRTAPQARLLVVGRRPSARLRSLLGSQPWMDFWEDAPSMADAYARARCVLMPFTSGSGTKLKVYEAMAFGMPVVATSRGVRGVDVDPGVDVLVAEDADGLAALAAGLMADPETARRLGRAARAAFGSRLSWERATYPQLAGLLDRLT